MLAVANVLGLLLASFSASCLLPLACSLWFRDGQWSSFLITAVIGAGCGALLAGATSRSGGNSSRATASCWSRSAWLLLPAVAALPLLLGMPGLTSRGAFFEAMSGLTTTGSTVLTGLDTLPPSLNFWRHLLEWMGGLGIIVMALAVMPLLGVGGMQLYKGLAPGSKDERLAPRITETAKNLWIIYMVLTAAGVVSLRLCGMSWFDAMCHAFSAVGLGGFSTHDRSIAYFDSAAIECVLIALMVIASLNFARHYIALRQLSLETYRKDPGVQGHLRFPRAQRRRHRGAAEPARGVSGLWRRRCARRPSMSSRRPRPAASRRRTTRAGRCSPRGGCCSCRAWCAAPARPAGASRCSVRCCWCARRDAR